MLQKLSDVNTNNVNASFSPHYHHHNCPLTHHQMKLLYQFKVHLLNPLFIDQNACSSVPKGHLCVVVFGGAIDILARLTPGRQHRFVASFATFLGIHLTLTTLQKPCSHMTCPSFSYTSSLPVDFSCCAMLLTTALLMSHCGN